MREAQISRKTRETAITMRLAIAGEGAGGFFGSSGIGFFDHMLSSFAVHGGFKIEANIEGDLYVDGHHSVEDTGIVLGRLFAQILGDRSGIARFGSAYVPMDECLAFAAVDISGRPFLVLDAEFSAPQIGGYDTQLTKEFFRALAFNMGATLHLRLEYGGNAHHETEALFKAAARAISAAVAPTGGGVLSTKGTLG
ncbi:MAG: imidazoleglycerol-phosphate dehydratase HisB [Eubacteriales bacterium]|jgi:imidazoleglycerol-phosphate dehydratase|nr:imidazoleglycerol-phosphate dehydratase HisB [Clostridiales bacterium]